MAKDEDHGDTARRVITITIILLLLLLTIPKLPCFPKKGPDTTTDPTTDPIPYVVADPNPDTVEDPDTSPDTTPAEIPDPSTPPTEIPTPEPPESPVVVPPLPFPVDVPYPEDGEIPAVTGSGEALPMGISDAFLYGFLFAIPFLGPAIEPVIVGLGSLLGGGNILPAPAQVIRSPAQVEQVEQPVMPERFFEFLQASDNHFYRNEYGTGLIPTTLIPAIQINSELDRCFYNLSRDYGGENVSMGWKHRVTDTPQGKEGTVYYGNYIIIRFYGEDYVSDGFLKNFTRGLIDNPYKGMERIPPPKPSYYRDYVIVMEGNKATVGFRNSTYSFPYLVNGSDRTVTIEGSPVEVLDYAERQVDRKTAYWEYNIEQRPSGLYRFVATSPEGRAFVYHAHSMQEAQEVASMFGSGRR